MVSAAHQSIAFTLFKTCSTSQKSQLLIIYHTGYGQFQAYCFSLVFWLRFFLEKSSCCHSRAVNVCHSLAGPDCDSCPKDSFWPVVVNLLLSCYTAPSPEKTPDINNCYCNCNPARGLTVILRLPYCSCESVSLLTLVELLI